MSPTDIHNNIIRYLKGMLSNRERHTLEKELMKDSFNEEAFEGLSMLSGDILQEDMQTLTNRLNDRIAQRKHAYSKLYPIAASVIILTGLSFALYLLFKSPVEKQIAQETHEKKEEMAETKIPEASPGIKPVTKENSKSLEENKVDEIKTDQKTQSYISLPVQMDEIELEDGESPVMEYKEPAAPSISNQALAAKKAEAPKTSVISARVVDGEGEELPGVTIVDKESRQMAITDADGRFSMNAGDSSILAFQYLGFMPAEYEGEKINGKDIVLSEDLVSLDEVVVVGYGTKRKREADGSQISSKPVPPGGNLMNFKQWVENRIDTIKLKPYTGEYRLRIGFTVNTNGTLSDIHVMNKIPDAIAREYLRVLAMSPQWKPAISNNIPVEAEVIIRFILIVREQPQ